MRDNITTWWLAGTEVVPVLKKNMIYGIVGIGQMTDVNQLCT